MDQIDEKIETQRPINQSVPKTFVANVFTWMFAALGITAAVAYLFVSNDALFSTLIQKTAEGGIKMSLLGWVVMFAPLLIVFMMSFRINRMSVKSMVALYIVYSIFMGISLSFIFWTYTTASIFKTFVIAAGMFGVMAIVGYTTKTDLTRLGPILLMALVGIIIATLVNFFMHSVKLDYIVSIIGVIIFTGLTAYDVNTIRKIGESGIVEGDTMTKITIHAALSLYLDFLNLFLYLLRFFGNSRD